MKAKGLNEVFFATIVLGLNGYFIANVNGNEDEDFTAEEFPEDFMPPPMRDDFVIRDDMSQNNLIQDKDLPKFGEPLQNITVPVGREALLSCVVDNLQTYKTAFLRVDTQTILTIQTHVITKNHRMVVTHAENRAWQLKIRDVKETDKGWYMCQINTDPMKSQIAYLNVVVPPDILDYPGDTSTDMVVKEGSNVTLKCSATGSPLPSITFRREDGEPIKLPGGIELSSINGSSFSIPRVDRLHMSAYLCIASNGIPPTVSKRIMLIVHFPPMMMIQNQLVGAATGQNVTLECTSEAFPKSINFWMRASSKNDSIITSGSKYVQEVFENIYKVAMKLTIIDVDMNDYGAYKCVAKNSLGETDGSIKLYQILRPTVPTTLATTTTTTTTTTTPMPSTTIPSSLRKNKGRLSHQNIDDDMSSNNIIIGATPSHWNNDGRGHEHRFQGPSSEVQRDADSLTEKDISSSATITTPSTTTLTKTFISVFHLKTSSASLTANLILNILLAHSYRVIM
ncbi:neurotrimin-like [Contarinia nasturtii]|uniref:neurotrimin-like n=1 Tax=Contarinia nasturtii TaxID=265458 RepID=UPI0012D3BE6D|nr:neurotrimin-like [Contarinia nasturtii]XP_031623889.1 neurotrimin-like [Contarinia nasturtii]